MEVSQKMSPSQHDPQYDIFRASVREHFKFLESKHGFQFTRYREDEGDGRDDPPHIVARYEGSGMRISVSWTPYLARPGAISFLFYFETYELPRSSRYAVGDPLFEYLTGGQVKSLVYPSSFVSPIEQDAMRADVLHDGLDAALKFMAIRLHDQMDRIINFTPSMLIQFHEWLRHH